MFKTLSVSPPDAIFGLNEAFKKDANSKKINLTIGVYTKEDGAIPILRCVKKAERLLLRDRTTMGYLGMEGIPEYRAAVKTLLFPHSRRMQESRQAVTVQTLGGTGALRVAAEFLHKIHPKGRIWCSRPTWANHANIFRAAGLKIKTYAYLEQATNQLAIDKMLEHLHHIPSGDFVCLHACCHNPTGIDPTRKQWAEIAKVVRDNKLFPIVDFAYQGFGKGIREDAVGLSELCGRGCELLICSSFSKNFSLYGERVGALTIVGSTAKAADLALRHVKTTIRANYSNPPRHGATIVAIVLGSTELRRLWESELAEMRNRINAMRQLFVDKLNENHSGRDYSFIGRQHGMFSLSGLSPKEAKRLRTQYSIYIVEDGRINVAGINKTNVDRLCEAILQVTSSSPRA